MRQRTRGIDELDQRNIPELFRKEKRPMRTFEFEDGKYKIVRDDRGMVTEAYRHGEPWPAALDFARHSKLFSAMLDTIEALQDNKPFDKPRAPAEPSPFPWAMGQEYDGAAIVDANSIPIIDCNHSGDDARDMANAKLILEAVENFIGERKCKVNR
jgi:hypothetical protein